MPFEYGESVDILTAGTLADPYSGDLTANWSTPTSVTVYGVAVEPRPSSEPVQDARHAVVSGYTLYLPPGTVIGPHDRVVVRGKTYDILGEAADWRSPFTGWHPGLVVQVGRTDG